ncbi:Cysteine-rich receptor-like protein kinase 25 [Linum grandiflorum]
MINYSSPETLLIPFSILEAANKLGQGGFGAVYKGKCLTGKEIALKRLLKSSIQGLEELKTEVMLVAKLQHTNLVRLLGFCIEGKAKLLVYQYIPNRNSYSILYSQMMDTINCTTNCPLALHFSYAI